MRKSLAAIACLLGLGAVTVAAQEASDRFYQAIRNNDLASLRTLVKSTDVNTKDRRESTPLMYAAGYGSIDAMKLLLAAGAEVNGKNAFDATPVMWCASDLVKVRLLVEKGANVNARSKQGRTPLMIAAAHDGNSETVKLLIEKGADVLAHDRPAVGQNARKHAATALSEAAAANDTASVRLVIEKGAPADVVNGLDETPLMSASSNGNLEVMKLLLAKGADVNKVSVPEDVHVKNGPIDLGDLTPLLYATTFGGLDAVKLLLDAGAKVNAPDARGMTPLMTAIATDRADPRVIRLLLERGADPNTKSKAGETARDWARKSNDPGILQALGIDRKETAAVSPLLPEDEVKLPTPKQAAEKSLALLQRASSRFFAEGGCVSCHAQNLTGLAVSVARSNGMKVDEAEVAARLKTVKLHWTGFEQVLLQRLDPPGAVDTISYSLFQLAAEGVPADHAIDAMIHNIAGEQRKDGRWHYGETIRPPIEDGDFSRTALAVRALSVYGIPGRQAEFNDRIDRGARWLRAANPRTTEDRNMQLLGLKWASADRRSLEEPLQKLIAMQRADGGWPQTPDLGSDAYATGSVLYAMHELGVPPTSAAYRRGVAYLLRTQLPDGSWHVVGRAAKFQPYFQSGFPHDHDQWISAAATAWAGIALINASEQAPARAAVR